VSDTLVDGRPPGNRPAVTVKIAQTLDGRIATRTGQSQWISGEASRGFAHELRAAHEAVLVGIGTVLHDDPRLTVRLVQGEDPLRVVADTLARTPLDCHLLADRPERTIIATSEAAPTGRIAALRRRGARILFVRTNAEGRLDLTDLLERLADQGIGSMLVEGGAGIVTSLLKAGLVDRLVVCIAPKLIGAGLEAIGDLGIRHLADAMTFARVEVRQLGDDVIVDGRLAS
jgi:5-amino-6-(5-phosphoribosylamino)uracil reductase/diaminohydroxyphosphoribosylaminopyrimidine deaminase/5-amino-6-(5-phosphoribosylamino)uracil reductase